MALFLYLLHEITQEVLVTFQRYHVTQRRLVVHNSVGSKPKSIRPSKTETTTEAGLRPRSYDKSQTGLRPASVLVLVLVLQPNTALHCIPLRTLTYRYAAELRHAEDGSFNDPSTSDSAARNGQRRLFIAAHRSVSNAAGQPDTRS